MTKRILVIEDNLDNMYLATFALEHAGYRVLQALNGEEGVGLVRREMPDLILMDLQMPGMDGLETTRRIRALEAGGSVPIVALTSMAMSGDRQRALDAGCNGYLEKPLNPETFIRDVASFFQGD